MKGKVKWFNANKGHGYIIGDDGKEYFYRIDDLPIRSDDVVEFTPSRNSRGIIATDVELLVKADYDEAERKNNEYRTASQPTQKKSGCFIATAVYGDYNTPEVMVLRRFRDEKLLPNRYGKKFVSLYYRFSPPVAEFLKKQPRLAGFVRKLLDSVFVNRLR